VKLNGLKVWKEIESIMRTGLTFISIYLIVSAFGCYCNNKCKSLGGEAPAEWSERGTRGLDWVAYLIGMSTLTDLDVQAVDETGKA
jgi:hypothetical protein